uniref:hypothetical protein n=1 Tax=Gemmatimonas sp. TaxID=1962908 RepID=UPI003341F21F
MTDLRPTRTALRCYFCHEPVDRVQTGWMAGKPAYCTAHHAMVDYHPWAIGQDAISYAEWMHDLPTEALISWPWRAVNELAGPLAPGRLTYVAAFPGGGKTTWLTHCLYYW